MLAAVLSHNQRRIGVRLWRGACCRTRTDFPQRVLHGKYGEGVILQLEGSGERAKVQVNFAEGAKWLAVSYANLQILDA